MDTSADDLSPPFGAGRFVFDISPDCEERIAIDEHGHHSTFQTTNAARRQTRSAGNTTDSAGPEATKVDRPRALTFGQQKRCDQESRQREKGRNAEETAVERADSCVVRNHSEQRDRA
jgi:hypothetical protein